MTTAHRPTFDPARGKEALRGPAYHQRLLPAHTHLKYRKAGQGGDADDEPARDLAAELLAAEKAHFSKSKKLGHNNGAPLPSYEDDDDDDEEHEDENRNGDGMDVDSGRAGKRPLHVKAAGDRQGDDDDDDADNDDAEDPESKRRRILAETREMDADDDSEEDDEDSSDEDSDDEDAELQRELERVRKEREEKKKLEEAERAKVEQEARERDIALGNPLLNKQDFTMKRRWDDDVVFKNQARGTEDKNKKKEFVNDLLRSDFHRRFMNKYVR